METKIGQNDTKNLDGIVHALLNKKATLEQRIQSTERVLTHLWDEKNNFPDQVYLWEQKIEELYACRDAVQAEIEQYQSQRDDRVRRSPGVMAFTLTYSPTWGWTDAQAREHMETALSRIQHYYQNELLRFVAIGEVGKNGLSHVHGMYHLRGGRRVTTKNWKRAYPKWNPKVRVGSGFQGGYHAPVADPTNYIPYVEEDLRTAWVVVDTNNGSPTENNPQVVQEEGRTSSSESDGTSDA